MNDGLDRRYNQKLSARGQRGQLIINNDYVGVSVCWCRCQCLLVSVFEDVHLFSSSMHVFIATSIAA